MAPLTIVFFNAFSQGLKKTFEKCILVCRFCDKRRAILRTYSRKANPIFKKII